MGGTDWDKKVAISYGGGDREFIRQVDLALLDYFDGDDVFYDERYTALFGRPDAGSWLASVYRKARLVVIFYSKSHAKSPWCQRELNAARDRNVQGGEYVQLFHFGEASNDSVLGFGMEYWLNIEDKYKSDPKAVAKDIAAFYNQQVRKKGEASISKKRRLTKTRIFTECAVGAAIVGALTYFALTSNPEFVEKFSKEYLAGKDAVGLASLGGTFLTVIFLLFRLLFSSGKVDKPPAYQSLPEASHSQSTNSASTVEEWSDYSESLESHYQKQVADISDRLLAVRQGRILMRAGVLMGIVYACFQMLLQISMRKHTTVEHGHAEDGAFIMTGPWGWQDIYTHHQGHGLLLGGAAILAFLFCLWFAGGEARNQSVAWTVGLSAPLLVGFAYIAFLVGLSYEDIFPIDKDGFYQESGNFHVLERVIIIPISCYLAGWLGCLLRKRLQRVPG